MVIGCPCSCYEAYERVEVEIHAFLTSALNEGEWSALSPGQFNPGERTSSIH
jgi:hypothetical protein